MIKVGILSGTFDPIHNGHIALAKAALEEAELDRVYLLIEKTPRNKQKVTDYIQRKAMVEIALQDQDGLELIEVPSEQFSVEKTLPELLNRFEDTKLFLVQGSDVASCLDCWPGIEKLAEHFDFIIGPRNEITANTKPSFIRFQVIKAKLPRISSGQIRANVQKSYDLLNPIVGRYIETQKLYDSV